MKVWTSPGAVARQLWRARPRNALRRWIANGLSLKPTPQTNGDEPSITVGLLPHSTRSSERRSRERRRLACSERERERATND
jgi:hypothetical protein